MQRKGNPFTLLVGMYIGTAIIKNSMKVPQKTRVAIWSSDPTPGHLPRQNCNSKRDVHPCVHSSTIYNSQDMETTQMSTDPLTDEWIKNIRVYIQFNTICSDMNGPRDYHSKQSKSEKDKYHMISLIRGT